MILASKAAVKKFGLKPIARIWGGTWAAGEAWRYVESPGRAVKKLSKTNKIEIADVDLFENNEAFALSNLLFHLHTGVPFDKLNVHGGSIALGHPIGCTGTRIIVTLINALRIQKKQLGIASVCHGTGGSTALGIEIV